MKYSLLATVMMVSVLTAGVCQAEKWEKNSFVGNNIEAGYYDATSIKVHGKLVDWTEKYVYAEEGKKMTKEKLAKYPVCKAAIEKKGLPTEFRVDYQIDNGDKSRYVAKRYYNAKGEVLCTDKDMKGEFDTSWQKIVRNSPMQNAYYDLVTKYKVVFK